ncbi:MAG: ABC transporter ATP-binding protein [Planctomycetota bacterium]
MSETKGGAPVNAVLEVQGLHKQFKQGERTIAALQGVDLTLAPGELVAVMGASGSGKSTLLHCVAALTQPTAGQIRFQGGKDVASLTDAEATRFRRDEIGLVFQAFNLLPTLTVDENVQLPLLAAGRAPAAGQVDALLQRLGLGERRGHRPDALSGGEQQRVAIGRALITEPALILADEPTGSLDSVTGASIMKLLSELCREQQKTVLVVTHEAAVAQWADRVVVFKDGRNLAELREESAEALSVAYQRAVAGEGATP